jgi:hypothetical protein
VDLQNGHGEFLGVNEENLVRLAKNKTNNLTDSKGKPSRISPKARGMD